MSSPPVPRRGVVYVASGERFIREAAGAAATVRRTNPDLPVCLVADRAWDDAVFDTVIVLEKPEGGIGDKLQMDRAPFEQTVFLDSDTAVLGSLDPIFTLLERFDLAAHQSSSGYHYTLPDVPETFPEFNTGVIAWKKNARTQAFFDSWRRRFDEHRDVMQREWDQRSFRQALFHSDVRFAVLMAEYNIMPYGLTPAMKDVVVTHGRDLEHITRFGNELNARLGPRVYVPRLGIIRHYNDMTLGELAKLTGRSAYMLGFETLKRAYRRVFRR